MLQSSKPMMSPEKEPPMIIAYMTSGMMNGSVMEDVMRNEFHNEFPEKCQDTGNSPKCREVSAHVEVYCYFRVHSIKPSIVQNEKKKRIPPRNGMYGAMGAVEVGVEVGVGVGGGVHPAPWQNIPVS